MVTLASTAIKESMALGADDLQKRVALLAAAANLSRFSFIDNTTTLGDTPEIHLEIYPENNTFETAFDSAAQLDATTTRFSRKLWQTPLRQTPLQRLCSSHHPAFSLVRKPMTV
ncbi:hypothetical protein E4U10_000554 [Claviceps purpurea]|nr:hypothetical protein E4U10_000554 [Claviceps purpurea]